MNELKKLGTKFEIWGEKLFRDLSCFSNLAYRGLRRNIRYYRGNHTYRQVDLEYFNILDVFSPFVILEFKYSSNGNVHLALREIREKSKQKVKHIDSIVNETEERRKFVKADKAIIVTNKYFDDDIKKEVNNYRKIELYDYDTLVELDKKRNGFFGLITIRKGKSIDEQIKKINLRKYKLQPYIVHV